VLTWKTQRLKRRKISLKKAIPPTRLQQLDFELVLFAPAIVDDYIMA